MGIMEYELKVTEPEEKSIKAEINGSELASLIKKRSEVIDAVQSMTCLLYTSREIRCKRCSIYPLPPFSKP